MSESKSYLDIKVSHRSYSAAAHAIGELAPIWQQLESKAETHFFLSWAWIESWLRISPLPLLVVEAKSQDQTVGIGLFSQRVTKKFGLIPIRQLWLNRCGDGRHDQIWIEYNDCLLRRGEAPLTRQAIYQYIFQHENLCDELYIGLTIDSALPIFCDSNLNCRTLIESFGFTKNIEQCSQDTLLSDFSSNTRKQIKRSVKLLGEKGKVEIRPAQGEHQKELWFEQIKSLHLQKWRDSQWGSGFDNALFHDFHQKLIRSKGSGVELLALVIDKEPTCFLYNLLDENSVYFYLSAIPPERDNRIKLGLVAHTLAMARYAQQGFKCYDFLAGENRYKQSLSDTRYSMRLACYHRRSFTAKIEGLLRHIKSWGKRSN
ncbi:GNAT family N-acetyltransferase [Neiella marina]|uniref:GNAT family N-acetyltransferase n=1 Tax=Neiella holothuriorum TaxID=2870530 RepID=A0ABS7EGY5_9GAMM|nr:GNAT family N-acetyltransferase [Neiella holothuriorum]MBW8191612.1 GNAT family N-acetyltransferase [Neiella holothuriorum]